MLKENGGGRRSFFSTFSIRRPIPGDSFETDHWEQLNIVYSRTANRNNFRVALVNHSKENEVDSLFVASGRAADRIARGECSGCAVRQHLS